VPKRKIPTNDAKNGRIGERRSRKAPVLWIADHPGLAYPIPTGDPGAEAENWVLARMRTSLGIHDRLKEDADLVAIVEGGLSIAAVSALIRHGILEKEIYAVIIPRRTLQHRRMRKEKLSREESDRAVRLARLAALAEDVFGAREAENAFAGENALRWLRAPKKRFWGRTPMDMIATETGSRLVEEALYQIDEGMAA
jgi:putative toxin-antitoxin system antitoxin component (TIGR02293 family)